jgi:hypothetical protein
MQQLTAQKKSQTRAPLMLDEKLFPLPTTAENFFSPAKFQVQFSCLTLFFPLASDKFFYFFTRKSSNSVMQNH